MRTSAAGNRLRSMKLDDFRSMRRLGERKLAGEANLSDMSEVRVEEFENAGVKVQLDQRNRRFRRIENGELSPWEKLEG